MLIGTSYSSHGTPERGSVLPLCTNGYQQGFGVLFLILACIQTSEAGTVGSLYI
jgi:hypothetical protein